MTAWLHSHFTDLQPLGFKHSFAAEGRAALARYTLDGGESPPVDSWQAYYKFAFVRNPWDRLVSWYTMIANSPRRRLRLWKYVDENARSFDEFVRYCTATIVEPGGERKSFCFNQLDYISDASGKIIVDFVGQFERLRDDLQTVARRLDA